MVGDHDVREGQGCDCAVVTSDSVSVWRAGLPGILLVVRIDMVDYDRDRMLAWGKAVRVRVGHIRGVGQAV